MNPCHHIKQHIFQSCPIILEKNDSNIFQPIFCTREIIVKLFLISSDPSFVPNIPRSERAPLVPKRLTSTESFRTGLEIGNAYEAVSHVFSLYCLFHVCLTSLYIDQRWSARQKIYSIQKIIKHKLQHLRHLGTHDNHRIFHTISQGPRPKRIECSSM